MRHDAMGREFPQILPTRAAAFALGDYEWIFAIGADELLDPVNLIRRMRRTDAPLHAREEPPFCTGRRITTGVIVEALV
ncbi:MAG: chlorite dismutase family protein [Lacisediminihabitans sp.]